MIGTLGVESGGAILLYDRGREMFRESKESVCKRERSPAAHE